MEHGELWNHKVEKQEISDTYLYLSFVILRFFFLFDLLCRPGWL